MINYLGLRDFIKTVISNFGERDTLFWRMAWRITAVSTLDLVKFLCFFFKFVEIKIVINIASIAKVISSLFVTHPWLEGF
jgi:hypothetical protein